jgi:hypothetical protein
MDFFEFIQGFDFLHVAFGLNFLSLFMKDILYLRFMALGSQATFWAVGYSRGNSTIVIWQSLFILINLVRTAMVLWERREKKFPPEIERIFKTHFPTFTRQEFQIFWEAGVDRSFAESQVVVQEGQMPEALWFIIQGDAKVIRSGKQVAAIGQGHFIGEMSLMTDQPASAEVRPITSELKTHEWKWEALKKLKTKRSLVWLKIQGRLGRDLVHKIWAKHELEEEGSL